mgnify:CR=1 FL=1
MTISYARLADAEPSPGARRLFWHVLSIGRVSRDEPERHAALDKAGAFLFRVCSGKGSLQVDGRVWRLAPGPRCWLIDLAKPRAYLPDAGQCVVTEGVRFGGPDLPLWLEALGGGGAFAFEASPRDFAALRAAQGRLASLVRRRAQGWEWDVHLELTRMLGWLLRARGVLPTPPPEPPAPVARVLNAVWASPRRRWRARDLAAVARVSYSVLREQFRAARRETLHDFLHRTRVDQARLLLGDPRLSVKEVARRLDFPSEYAFSHYFRYATGTSPSAFRRRSRP